MHSFNDRFTFHAAAEMCKINDAMIFRPKSASFRFKSQFSSAVPRVQLYSTPKIQTWNYANGCSNYIQQEREIAQSSGLVAYLWVPFLRKKLYQRKTKSKEVTTHFWFRGLSRSRFCSSFQISQLETPQRYSSRIPHLCQVDCHPIWQMTLCSFAMCFNFFTPRALRS